MVGAFAQAVDDAIVCASQAVFGESAFAVEFIYELGGEDGVDVFGEINGEAPSNGILAWVVAGVVFGVGVCAWCPVSTVLFADGAGSVYIIFGL